MEQGPLDIKAQAKLAAEKIDRSLRNGASYPIIDGGPWEEPARAVEDAHRGLMRKLADAAYYLITGRHLGDPFHFRKRD